MRRTWHADLFSIGVTVAHEHPQAPADLTPPAQLPWFRRLAARLLGRGLTRLQAQHRDSWFLGHATGQRSGHEDGVREGFERGRVEGYEAGRQVLVIRDTRPDTAAVPGQDNNLFDDWRLPLTTELVILADGKVTSPKKALVSSLFVTKLLYPSG